MRIVNRARPALSLSKGESCSCSSLRYGLAAGAILCAMWGCSDSTPQNEERAANVPQGPASASASPVPHVALPRTVVGLTLGMMRLDAETKLGPLNCHENKAGYQVCSGTTEQIDDARHIEVYLNHDQVISLSYEGPPPANAFDALNELIDRYGRPALSGMRERDTTGRLHEIYGWKDDQSLYSVRFIWRETESQDRELVGTVVALWDRKGYQLWESETQQRSAPTASANSEREPI